MFRSKRLYSGINLHDLEKTSEMRYNILKFERFRKFYNHRNNGKFCILLCSKFAYSDHAALIKNAC